MPAPVLTRREGVELARTGVWPISTGVWTAAPEDFAAAVAATACPAVRRPYLRLGHIDPRFGTPVPVQGDGEPALGWIENLRTADGGHTLLGDYVGVPEWLDTIMATAYPDRSVEGKYSWRCQLGHTHPFVLQGLALLGVTPPGVGTLKPIESLSDVANLFGVAASGDDNGLCIAATIPGDVVRAHLPGKHDQDDHAGGGSGTRSSKTTERPSSSGGSSPASAPDNLNLAARIKLGRGESLAGSDVVDSSDGVIPVAAIRTADGLQLRIGVGIAAEDSTTWAAANKGGTANLDMQAISDLRDALGHMHEVGARIQAEHDALVARENDLRRRERALIQGQYKNLTKTQRRELDRLDRRISETEAQIERLENRRRERADRLPDDLRARWDAAGTAERLRIISDWHDANPEFSRAGVGLFQAQDDERQRRLSADLDALQRQRSKLTAGGGQLSPEDRAEVERIARELDEVADAYDTLESLDDVVRGDWADITYETFVEDGEVRYFLGIRPHDGGPVDPTPITPDQIRDLDEMLGRLVGAASGGIVRAAAEAHTGAMVALIPSPADAERLAVAGGEPAEQLHVTLAYLGDASDLDAAARQDIIDAVSTSVNGAPVIEATGFYVASFNPPGVTDGDGKQRDTCVVLGLSGDDLDLIHTLVGDALDHSDAGLPSQHAPWHAHMTLRYTDDLSQAVTLADRAGPVRFDRLRIALAGQHIDIPLIAQPEPDEADDPADIDYVAAAGEDGNALKRYWLGKGLHRWATKRHPWTSLFRLLAKHVGVERAKRIASQWFHDHFGYWPGDRRHRKVSAQIGETMPNPQPDLPERVRQAWNASRPYAQWIVRVDDGTVLACDEDAGRVFSRVPYTVDGDAIAFGEPEPLDGLPVAAMAAGGGTVYASRAESRPEPGPDVPAAEPESTTETKEDPVSTLSEDLRSRLGLTDADDAALLAAVDELKTKAETPTAPDPTLVAAAAENATLAEKVTVLTEQVSAISQELADTKAAAAATVKASVFDTAVQQGKLRPADRESWEARYDRAPDVITEVLASIAPGTAVPIAAAGSTGTAGPGDADTDADTDAEFEAMMARLDGPTAAKGA